MAWPIRSLAVRIARVTALFALLLVCLVVIYPAYRRAVDNPVYAATMFEDVETVVAIRASRRWHRWGAEPWDCSFAIADLAPDAPREPEGDTNDDRDWSLRWGGDWQATPAPPPGDTTRDAVEHCGQYYDPEISVRVRTALAEPGSFFIRDTVGETVMIWSAPQRLAARIRFGD